MTNMRNTNEMQKSTENNRVHQSKEKSGQHLP